MFQRFTSLFFGSSEEPPVVVPPARAQEEEEEWQLVSVSEADMPIGSGPLVDPALEQPSFPALLPQTSQPAEDTVVSLLNNTSLADDEVPIPVSGAAVRRMRGVASQARVLAKVTHIGRVQQAQARAHRCLLGRNCIQRQNGARQRLPRHASRQRPNMLHQPGRRNFCH